MWLINGQELIEVESIKDLNDNYDVHNSDYYYIKTIDGIAYKGELIAYLHYYTGQIDPIIPQPLNLERKPVRTLTEQIAREIRKENDWVEPLDLDTYLRKALTAKEVGGIKLGI